MFPFHYNAVMYYTCTYQDHDKPWCSITMNFDRDGVWGECIGTAVLCYHAMRLDWSSELYTSPSNKCNKNKYSARAQFCQPLNLLPIATLDYLK